VSESRPTEGDVRREDAFNAAKAAFSFYGGYFKSVAEEIGLEKAISLHAKQAEFFDVLLVEMLRERLGDKEIDLGVFASARSEALAVLGITARIEEAPNSITLGVRRCPLYEGLRMAGVEHATIEAMCRRGVELGYARISEAFPRVSGVLKFRLAPEEACLEDFTTAATTAES